MTLTGLLTYPEQAKDYVAQTGVDALAIGIGTSHGAYKFTRRRTGIFSASIALPKSTRRFPVRTS